MELSHQDDEKQTFSQQQLGPGDGGSKLLSAADDTSTSPVDKLTANPRAHFDMMQMDDGRKMPLKLPVEEPLGLQLDSHVIHQDDRSAVHDVPPLPPNFPTDPLIVERQMDSDGTQQDTQRLRDEPSLIEGPLNSLVEQPVDRQPASDLIHRDSDDRCDGQSLPPNSTINPLAVEPQPDPDSNEQDNRRDVLSPPNAPSDGRVEPPLDPQRPSDTMHQDDGCHEPPLDVSLKPPIQLLTVDPEREADVIQQENGRDAPSLPDMSSKSPIDLSDSDIVMALDDGSDAPLPDAPSNPSLNPLTIDSQREADVIQKDDGLDAPSLPDMSVQPAIVLELPDSDVVMAQDGGCDAPLLDAPSNPSVQFLTADPQRPEPDVIQQDDGSDASPLLEFVPKLVEQAAANSEAASDTMQEADVCDEPSLNSPPKPPIESPTADLQSLSDPMNQDEGCDVPPPDVPSKLPVELLTQPDSDLPKDQDEVDAEGESEVEGTDDDEGLDSNTESEELDDTDDDVSVDSEDSDYHKTPPPPKNKGAGKKGGEPKKKRPQRDKKPGVGSKGKPGRQAASKANQGVVFHLTGDVSVFHTISPRNIVSQCICIVRGITGNSGS